MKGPQKLGEVVPCVALVYFAIFMWETSTSTTTHTDSWSEGYVSVLALPIGAVWIARQTPFRSWAFIYGVGGSLLFVSRFFHMDRFGLWLTYRAPSTMTIGWYWLLFALGLGAACRFAAAVNTLTEDQ
ncbi:MAG: hypothetical protein V4719_05155 [Planctomycetota bacterium]